MKNSIKQHILAAASVAMLSVTSHATVIFNDTFGSGTGAWYIGSTVNQGGNSTLANTSGQLQFTVGTAQNKDELIGRSFTEQSLAVGQTIRLTFDFRQTATTGIFRIGFADRSATALTSDGWAYTTSGTGSGTYAGYYSFIRDNSASANAAREDASASFTNVDNSGAPTFGATSLTSVVDSFTSVNINDDGTVTYQGLFEVTRTSLTQTTTLFTLKEGLTTRFSVSGVDTTSPFTTFDTALLRADSGTAFFDNVKVEVIPEPRAALLSGLGLLALLRRRR